MQPLVLDTNFIDVDVVDTFDSLIWTERYSKYGDFEIYTPVSAASLSLLKKDYYLYLQQSEHVMIIEDLKIETDIEKGNYIVVTGRSLESILDRRIVWKQTILNGNLQTEVQRLLNENVISPTDVSRRIDNFIFESSINPAVTSLTIDAQFTGDNLYDVIRAICQVNDIGFKITLTDDNKFKFKLYSGADRSYDQVTNPYVEFSPKFDNITSSEYIESKKPLKTVTLVAGEGEGINRKTLQVNSSTGAGTGINRREMFTDARDISSDIDGGTLTTEQYNAQLTQRGVKDLAENVSISAFEGQVDTTLLYKYGEDFFMGDILQITNEYGMEARSRVVEIVRSKSNAGEQVRPTFAVV